MNKKIKEMSFEELLEEINKNNPETVNQAKTIMYEKYLKRFDKQHKKHLTLFAAVIIIIAYIIFLFIMYSFF